ncbi:hypothetical protein AB751O23_BX_00050 [Chlamydiales bacterium SCGC AB-751-O23]|nr:hypothetical protein AB751O23_BX_00050 [Chlamydiales bacterium SCGC AB-751-O23]
MNLPVAVTRCGNFFGGGDLNWSRIVPGTIRSVLRGESPVIRSSGKMIRDYIYVEDAVSAYLTLSFQLSKNSNLRGQAFNFSNESQKNVLELAQLITELLKSSMPLKILGEDSNEIDVQYLDSSKAYKYLGWRAQFSLEEGLKKTIEWYQNYFLKSSSSNKLLKEQYKVLV